jgi:HEPN domain-containing protein
MMTKQEHINYWLTTADHDLESAFDIFNVGRYDWALFVAHLALEKILKALWVKNNESNIPPRIHNLVTLAQRARLDVSADEAVFLGEVTTFNIEARYPEQKFTFYKLATREFTEKKLHQIKDTYECIRQRI